MPPAASAVQVRKHASKAKVAHEAEGDCDAPSDGRRRVQVACARCRFRKIKISSRLAAPPLCAVVRTANALLRRLHCDGMLPACTKCLNSRDGAECHYAPVSFEENAAARAKKQRGPGLPAQSSIRLRRSWDEAGARSETVSSRRSRSLSSGMPSAPVTSFAPIEPYTPYHRQQSSGLTRTVDSLHISEMPYGFEAAPFPSSMSSYSSSESPVEPHFPHLLPVSWSPHMQPAYSSASYPPHHLPTPHQSGQSSRPSSSGVPFPQHLATDLTAHRYVAWDRPTPPSEVTSPRTSEPETFAYTAYAPPSHRQPPPPRQQPSRPRLHHSLSLPVGSSDGQYSQLVAHEYTYHHPPYAEDGRRHFSHTAHASSVTQERQANIEAYFSNQGHPQMYRTRYEDGYDVQQQPHDGRRLSDNFSPDMSFTPAHELLATPSMMDRSLSPGDATIGGKEWSRRPSAGMGLGVPLPEVMTDEFGFKYAPTW